MLKSTVTFSELFFCEYPKEVFRPVLKIMWPQVQNFVSSSSCCRLTGVWIFLTHSRNFMYSHICVCKVHTYVYVYMCVYVEVYKNSNLLSQIQTEICFCTNCQSKLFLSFETVSLYVVYIGLELRFFYPRIFSIIKDCESIICN